MKIDGNIDETDETMKIEKPSILMVMDETCKTLRAINRYLTDPFEW